MAGEVEWRGVQREKGGNNGWDEDLVRSETSSDSCLLAKDARAT